MLEILRATAVHVAVSTLFSLLIWHFMGPTDAFYAAWGCALGLLPTLGFGFLVDRNVTSESAKKGVALVIAGSVLRYGIFLALVALLVFSNLRIPNIFIGGLLIWVPSSAVIAALARRQAKE